ncbi:MAG TPA: sugar ABC transporter permease [Fimbriimonadaceae bacterium]|nr:sugar ABC transporter permease [Fimbriimonadaceae bacterium]
MRKGDGKAAALFLLPYGVLFLVFVLSPLLYGFFISLHKWHILDDQVPFVGFQNYRYVLQDDLFGIALARTLLFVAIVVPVGNALSLLLAVALNQRFLGTTFYKVAFYLPVLLTVSVLAVLWRWLYSAEYGILNHYLSRLHPSIEGVQWLNNPQIAMPAIALMSIWWGAGGNMLIYLAAIKSVPRELHEAAEIDGATPWQRFWRTTIPTIRPALIFCIVMSIIASSQVFGQTLILTGGGPAFSTLTVILYMYQQGFGQYQLGYASAVAYVLFLLVFVFTLLALRLIQKGIRSAQ